jgi:hypothetical protein
MGKDKRRLMDLWNNTKRFNIGVTGVSEVEKRQRVGGTLHI